MGLLQRDLGEALEQQRNGWNGEVRGPGHAAQGQRELSGTRWTCLLPSGPTPLDLGMLLCESVSGSHLRQTEAVPKGTAVTEARGLQSQPAQPSHPPVPSPSCFSPSRTSWFPVPTPSQAWEAVALVRTRLLQLCGETGQILHRGGAELREDRGSSKVTQKVGGEPPNQVPES